ncbi:hypothetical protein H8E88_31235 [candidate division KSB1 bacterium]|nr:hypothetical protein [candidate division KSB1 bacterium]
MKKIITLIILCIIVYLNCLYAKNVISLNIINIDELKYVKNYYNCNLAIIKGDTLVIGSNKYIYVIDVNKNIILRKKKAYSLSIELANNYSISHTYYENNGMVYLEIFTGLFEGKICSVLHHPNTGKIFYSSIDSTIIISGNHFTKYIEMLETYDENSETPSSYSRSGISQFYQQQAAYTLTKYDLSLNLIDSANFIERRGENYQGYNGLYMGEIFAVDANYDIYTIHKSSNYLIRKYSSDFKYLNEFTGYNEYFKPIPDQLTSTMADRMRNVPGSFSNTYSINVIDDQIIASFYQNPKNWDPPESPFYYDIYNQSGEKQHTGKIPYRIYTKDDENNLYFMVKKERSWLFSKDQYFLVSFTIDDLMNDRVNETFIENKIQKYLEAK